MNHPIQILSDMSFWPLVAAFAIIIIWHSFKPTRKNMKRSERYYRDARRQFALAALCVSAAIAFGVWVPFNAISLGIMCGLIVSYILSKACRFIVEGGNLRRLAKQSEQAEINRAIRPRL